MFKLFIMDGGSFWSAWPMSVALLRTILDMVSGLPTCRTLYWISILYIVNCVPWSNIQVPHCIETNGYRFLNNVIYRHYKSFWRVTLIIFLLFSLSPCLLEVHHQLIWWRGRSQSFSRYACEYPAGSRAASVAHQVEFEMRWLVRQAALLWPLDQSVLCKQALNPINLPLFPSMYFHLTQ